VDGVDVTDWFAGDFTLAEIKTLRRQAGHGRPRPEPQRQYAIPTLRR
jgi:glycerophosphoryl diester phosphodiesterase